MGWKQNPFKNVFGGHFYSNYSKRISQSGSLLFERLNGLRPSKTRKAR